MSEDQVNNAKNFDDRSYYHQELGNIKAEVGELRSMAKRTADDVASLFSIMRNISDKLSNQNKLDTGMLMIFVVLVGMAATLIYTLIGNESQQRKENDAATLSLIERNTTKLDSNKLWIDNQLYLSGKRDEKLAWLEWMTKKGLQEHENHVKDGHPTTVKELLQARDERLQSEIDRAATDRFTGSEAEGLKDRLRLLEDKLP